MSSSSLVPIASFGGSSTYASSFQQVLSRAVQIASLPGTQLQNSIQDLSGEQQALTGLLTSFAQLQGAITGIAAASHGSIHASVSNGGVLSASASASALPGTYTVTVDDIGSATTALSSAGVPPVTDPSVGNVANSLTYTLKINGVDQPVITPTGGSLQNLADAINSAGQGVQATIVNVGGSSGADYRLALTSTTLGANDIELNDSANTNILGEITLGSDVLYKVNGSAADIHSNTRQITLAPGLTVNILDEDPGNPVSVVVAKDQVALSNALSNLASVYNSAVDNLNKQRGENPGALAGQSIVFTLQDMMSSLAQYDAGSGSLSTLTKLGLEIDKTGHMSFSSGTFSSLSSNDVQDFLGSTSTTGFLKMASDALNSATDTEKGSITSNITLVQDQITRDQEKISDLQTRVNNLQTSLLAQLSKADAAIATLESQKTFFYNLFQATYFNKNNGG